MTVGVSRLESDTRAVECCGWNDVSADSWANAFGAHVAEIIDSVSPTPATRRNQRVGAQQDGRVAGVSWIGGRMCPRTR